MKSYEHHVRMTVLQRESLQMHLHQRDGCEAVAVVVCGTRSGRGRHVNCVHSIHPIPVAACVERTPIRVRWKVEAALPAINEAIQRGCSVLKIHSHPPGADDFSAYDDASDREFFGAINRVSDGTVIGVSAVMKPDGSIFARAVSGDGVFELARVMVVGDDIGVFGREIHAAHDEAAQRTRQAFGDHTTATLRSLRIGIAGCSGTGSWVIEMLSRLGVGELVLVDPDVVERRNLNRILNSTANDAANASKKVDVFARTIAAMGLGTTVYTHSTDLGRRSVVEDLASCDVLFGCVDSADGRELLNRIATYYTIPYFDVGVRLDADGRGGISQICAAVHYLVPGGSSLLSRGVITARQVGAEAMRRSNPAQHAALVKEGYVHGAAVGAPAVISLNGFAASHAVNELLARLHRFRADDSAEYRYQNFSLRDGAWLKVPDGPACPVISRKVGRGDCRPLLDNPALS